MKIINLCLATKLELKYKTKCDYHKKSFIKTSDNI